MPRSSTNKTFRLLEVYGILSEDQPPLNSPDVAVPQSQLSMLKTASPGDLTQRLDQAEQLIQDVQFAAEELDPSVKQKAIKHVTTIRQALNQLRSALGAAAKRT